MSQSGPPIDQIELGAVPLEDPTFAGPNLISQGRRSSKTATEAVRIEIDIANRDGDHILILDGAFAVGTVEYSRKDMWNAEVDHCYIDYGLARGELQVQLRNAVAPLRGRYSGSMAEFYTATTRLSRDRSWRTTSKGTIGLSPSYAADQEESATDGRETGTEYARATVTASGPDGCPAWRFECDDSARHIAGRPPGYNPPLAVLYPESASIAAIGTFTARADDLHLVAVDPKNRADKKLKKRLAVIGKSLPDIMWQHTAKAERGRLILAISSIELDVPTAGVF